MRPRVDFSCGTVAWLLIAACSPDKTSSTNQNDVNADLASSSSFSLSAMETLVDDVAAQLPAKPHRMNVTFQQMFDVLPHGEQEAIRADPQATLPQLAHTFYRDKFKHSTEGDGCQARARWAAEDLTSSLEQLRIVAKVKLVYKTYPENAKAEGTWDFHVAPALEFADPKTPLTERARGALHIFDNTSRTKESPEEWLGSGTAQWWESGIKTGFKKATIKKVAPTDPDFLYTVLPNKNPYNYVQELHRIQKLRKDAWTIAKNLEPPFAPDAVASANANGSLTRDIIDEYEREIARVTKAEAELADAMKDRTQPPLRQFDGASDDSPQEVVEWSASPEGASAQWRGRLVTSKGINPDYSEMRPIETEPPLPKVAAAAPKSSPASIDPLGTRMPLPRVAGTASDGGQAEESSFPKPAAARAQSPRRH